MTNYSPSLKAKAQAEQERRRRLAARLAQPEDDPLLYDNPADFLERQVIDPDSAKVLSLHEEQRNVLRAMNTRDHEGNFKYALWLYSAPKKSAKTTIGAGVALWQAWRVPRGEIYIIGNDQKQADNRMANIIRFTIENNPLMKSRVRPVRYTYHLDNGTRIEVIPVDPKGESGMNPTGIFWTEAWGAMGDKAEQFWSEATLSPTRSGQSFKFVESYAGYSGQSTVLERLYDGIVRVGVPDPIIPELYTNGASIGYWCTRRYLPWQQNPAYYAQEALSKTPEEFARQHDNQWATSTQAFIPPQWWDACFGDVTLGNRNVVIGLDAGVSNDCFALVVVGKSKGKLVAARTKVWYPPKGGEINFEDVKQEIRNLYKEFYVLEVAYDPHQLASMTQELRAEGVNCRKFDQGNPRLIADKKLYDAIRDRTIVHDGDPQLAAHIKNADRKTDNDDTKLRLVKRADALKIDASVALSMAHDRAGVLNL